MTCLFTHCKAFNCDFSYRCACSSWQHFNWHNASRGPSAIAKVPEHYFPGQNYSTYRSPPFDRGQYPLPTKDPSPKKQITQLSSRHFSKRHEANLEFKFSTTCSNYGIDKKPGRRTCVYCELSSNSAYQRFGYFIGVIVTRTKQNDVFLV